MSMEATVDARLRAQKLIFAVIWFAILGGLVMIHLFLGQAEPGQTAAPDESVTGLVGLAPLLFSIVVRWLVLPRFTEPPKALPVFIIGLAMAEACGILGIFLGGPYRDHLFILGLLGIVQFAPFLMPRLFQPPAAGFRQEV
jgi:hypothetical protein